ncbi:MAG: anthranilate synthase component II [Flavobacteriales bacterium]
MKGGIVVKILLLDNYDSFTYNIFHYLRAHGVEVDVFRNDAISVQKALTYNAIVLSPGPGLPSEAGIMMEVIKAAHSTKPILGVCLGLQAIIEFFGGSLKNLGKVIHGRSSQCLVTENSILFDNIQSPFEVGHYHSWVADVVPNDLIVTAKNEDNLVMAVRHKSLPIEAVQFHPESVLTPEGKQMIKNWVNSIKNI